MYYRSLCRTGQYLRQQVFPRDVEGDVWLTHSVKAGKTVLAAEERGTVKIV